MDHYHGAQSFHLAWTRHPFNGSIVIPVIAPSGEITEVYGRKINDNLRFPGQYYDAESGQMYNANRDYDPTVGRYVESDPIGLDGGSYSPYTYAFSNPLSNIDPTGEAPPGRSVPPGISIPVALPPIVIPGTPENDAWVQSAYQQIQSAINAVSSLICKNNDREKRCDHQYYKVDIPMCRAISRSRGKAAGQRCYAAAAQRYAACLRGQPLPPLDTWNN